MVGDWGKITPKDLIEIVLKIRDLFRTFIRWVGFFFSFFLFCTRHFGHGVWNSAPPPSAVWKGSLQAATRARTPEIKKNFDICPLDEIVNHACVRDWNGRIFLKSRRISTRELKVVHSNLFNYVFIILNRIAIKVKCLNVIGSWDLPTFNRLSEQPEFYARWF